MDRRVEMRLIYMHNNVTGAVIESHDVTDQTEVHCELLKLEMLARCHCPCDVFDSCEDGMPSDRKNRSRIGASASRSIEPCQNFSHLAVHHSTSCEESQSGKFQFDGRGHFTAPVMTLFAGV